MFLYWLTGYKEQHENILFLSFNGFHFVCTFAFFIVHSHSPSLSLKRARSEYVLRFDILYVFSLGVNTVWRNVFLRFNPIQSNCLHLLCSRLNIHGFNSIHSVLYMLYLFHCSPAAINASSRELFSWLLLFASAIAAPCSHFATHSIQFQSVIIAAFHAFHRK